ncbi:SRPBCC family protein [Rathayibacter rathayi]|uniref:SRPBCC family protein n=1 Tax=Rathayibacter rathayi TaxID=33887 RepID=UPI000CE71F5B|nr:SRPBCC domain-containing protein [Rathayibacter rathayi]PPG65659.1 SRPBCC family protein [Rathayibacter rathayi]PPG74479.1 SRPBCC family protein [Rathayibacter rathayi]PPI78260.1 SRPBCC family protein [Rathayibacter rathayi]
MSCTTRVVHCPPESVFAVLASGWLFPSWVVGASRMRKVDADFPHVGSRLHHSFGLWPLVIDDRTTVLEWDPPRRMVIQAAGWPLGEARVRIEVEPHARGAKVRMHEAPVKGPGTLLPKPLMHAGLWLRNREAVRRLAHMAEAGAAGRTLAPASLPSPADREGIDRHQHVWARLTGAIGLIAVGTLVLRGVLAAVRRARR